MTDRPENDALRDGGGTLQISAFNGTIDVAEAAATSEMRPGDYLFAITNIGFGMSDDVYGRALRPDLMIHHH